MSSKHVSVCLACMFECCKLYLPGITLDWPSLNKPIENKCDGKFALCLQLLVNPLLDEKNMTARFEMILQRVFGNLHIHY